MALKKNPSARHWMPPCRHLKTSLGQPGAQLCPRWVSCLSFSRFLGPRLSRPTRQSHLTKDPPKSLKGPGKATPSKPGEASNGECWGRTLAEKRRRRVAKPSALEPEVTRSPSWHCRRARCVARGLCLGKKDRGGSKRHPPRAMQNNRDCGSHRFPNSSIASPLLC